MFSYIKGEVVSALNGIAVLECNGIGYELTVSNFTAIKLNQGGKQAKLYCYFHVREDGVTLCGFHSPEEKSMFMRLIDISGIGPKAAMGILSGIELGALAAAIVTKDVKTLSKIKGIGKKTAERIVLELGESLAKDLQTESISISGTEPMDNDTADAVMALRSLGFAQQESVNAVKKAKAGARNIEELISNALRYL